MQGTYSNNPTIEGTPGDDNFGLDDYEPLFFRPPAEWTELGPFEVDLLFPEMEGFSGDIFYFCHIHNFMSGRIKLLKDDEALQPILNVPEIDYEVAQPSQYDATCGTFGLDVWQLPHPQCPAQFVCGVPEDNPEMEQFSDCIDSMNCHMFAGMTTGVKAENQAALFLHQMIPHHQNAVNMAKALLKTDIVQCDDLTEETDDCAMKIILLEIVNTQNHQIQTMKGLLEGYGFPPKDACIVEITSDADFTFDADPPETIPPFNDEKSGDEGNDGDGSDAQSCVSPGLLAAAGAVLAAL